MRPAIVSMISSAQVCAGWANAEPLVFKNWHDHVDTTEEDGVEQISDSCDDEYEFAPTQTLFQMEASKSPTARALVTVHRPQRGAGTPTNLGD